MDDPAHLTLNGKVALITGGGRGIGEAVALSYAREGADLILVSRTLKEVEVVSTEVRSLGRRVLAMRVDVSDEGQVAEMVRRGLDEFGQVDILVNNAGVFMGEEILTDIPLRDWDQTIAVNLSGPFLVSRAVLPSMIRARRGSIINVSSICGRVGYGGHGAYSASKCGVEGLTRVLAEEVRRYRIRVNAVDPGLVATRLTKYEGVKPDRVTHLFLYLASDESKRITGQLLTARRWRTEVARFGG